MQQHIAFTARGPIEYRLEGSGPVVMVLNGAFCSRKTRLSHERLTEAGFSVLTPSRPGYDGTPPEVGRTAQEAADALASLMETLRIPSVDLIGISAAGFTALAMAQRHPMKVRKLVLESAVTIPWDRVSRVGSRVLFGRGRGRLTWGLTKLMMRMSPRAMIRESLRPLTTLDVSAVVNRLSEADLGFVRRMIETSESAPGFMNEMDHRVDNLSNIRMPVLSMYSPYDKAVPVTNSQWVASAVEDCELYEVPADTHLLWIGPHAGDVMRKRESFLRH